MRIKYISKLNQILKIKINVSAINRPHHSIYTSLMTLSHTNRLAHLKLANQSQSLLCRYQL